MRAAASINIVDRAAAAETLLLTARIHAPRTGFCMKYLMDIVNCAAENNYLFRQPPYAFKLPPLAKIFFENISSLRMLWRLAWVCVETVLKF